MADRRFLTSPNFYAVTKIFFRNVVRNFTRARHEGLSCVLFLSCRRKIVNKSCFRLFFEVQTVFTSNSRPDKHAGLLKIYFKSLVKKSKFFSLAAKSDLKFKVH